MKPQPRANQASAPRPGARPDGPRSASAPARAHALVSSLRLVLPVLVSGLIGILIILPL